MLSAIQQSVIRRQGDALIAPEGLFASILQKFDWLEVADKGGLLRAWENLFKTIRPVALAPVHGRVQYGRELVEQVLERYRSAIFFPTEATALRTAVGAT
jgi:hypothetical protein